MSKTKRKKNLIALTVRLSPKTYNRLSAIVREKPHMSINVLVNEMLDRELSAQGGKDAACE